MKVLERVAENFLLRQLYINDMQFGFMPGHSTTDAIFIVSQLQDKRPVRIYSFAADSNCDKDWKK